MKLFLLLLTLFFSPVLGSLEWKSDVWFVESDHEELSGAEKSLGPILELVRGESLEIRILLLTPKAIVTLKSDEGKDKILAHWDSPLTKAARLKVLGRRALVIDPNSGVLKVWSLNSGVILYDHKGKPFTDAFLEGDSLFIVNGSHAMIIDFVKKGIKERKDSGLQKNKQGLWSYAGQELQLIKHKVFMPRKNGKTLIPTNAPLIGKSDEYLLFGNFDTIWVYAPRVDVVLTVKPVHSLKKTPETIRARIHYQLIDFLTPEGLFSVELDRVLSGIDLISTGSVEVETRQVLSTHGKLWMVPQAIGTPLALKPLESVTVYYGVGIYYRQEEWSFCRRESGEKGWVLEKRLGPRHNGRLAWTPNNKPFGSLLKLPIGEAFYQQPLLWVENPHTGKLLSVLEIQNRTKASPPGTYWLLDEDDEEMWVRAGRYKEFHPGK